MQFFSLIRTTLRSLVGLLLCLSAATALAVPALDDVVMYEVNLRAFSQAGDLAGVTARLDDIQALGANTIWLMPIHPVGQLNSAGGLGSPYSVQNYGLVGSEYGSLSDMNTLVTEAHNRGLSVLMDWVGNHTAWDNPWITAHPDWYTQDGQGHIISPPGTGWSDVADLNYDNAAMRAAMISEMQYWVADVGIDGYRVDAADFVPHDFWQQAIPAVRSSTQRPLLMLAEGARDDHYDAGFDLTWGFDFFNSVKAVFNSSRPATDFIVRHNQEFATVPAGKGILRYTTNHDESAWQETPPELFGGLDASLAAYAATVAYGGTPLVYNGQEIGWSENVPIFSKAPLDWNTGQPTEAWYSQLLAVHNNHPALRGGSLDDRSNGDIAMLMRETPGDQVLVMINTRNSTKSVPIPAGWQGQWTDQLTGNTETLSGSQSLNPYEVLFLTTSSIIDPPDNQSKIISDFNNVGLYPGYGSWGSGTVTTGPDSLRVVATGFGGSSGPVFSTLEAGGNTHAELDVTINSADGPVNIIALVEDADGTQNVWRWSDLTTDNGIDGTNHHVLSFRMETVTTDAYNSPPVLLDNANSWQTLYQDNTPGDLTDNDDLDLDSLSFFHVQVEPVLQMDPLIRDPNASYDVSFNNFAVKEILGGFDTDDDADGADFLTWQRGLTPNPLSSEDLLEWQNNYGNPAALAASSSAVPEPSALLIALASFLGLTARRRTARSLKYTKRTCWSPGFSLSFFSTNSNQQPEG